ncbi:hypothetical protein JCM21714_5 [Gracilibacillus boraciitolerans JCM 21714]|uniref:Uncharacterized protein n=1 Tax=Gracilibacillus boraciitolerans JCM 21714 TaxID=1298598 RepID=W4VCC7_9BACI|nr:hypothetical protein [Gracilibacillus boraciitolerans]GAE91070.1 hypothetical protein JCM21714_5 [Gracilibacillus boraciitolerans JCM 21714]
MGKIQSSEELMKYISNMNSDNSVFQFSIPGKGKFTLVLQEEDEKSIQFEAEENPELKQMLKESQEQYENKLGMSTSELLNSLSKKDFT